MIAQKGKTGHWFQRQKRVPRARP